MFLLFFSEVLFTSSPAPGTAPCAAVTRTSQLLQQRSTAQSTALAPTVPWVSGGRQRRSALPSVGPSSAGPGRLGSVGEARAGVGHWHAAPCCCGVRQSRNQRRLRAALAIQRLLTGALVLFRRCSERQHLLESVCSAPQLLRTERDGR